MKIIGLSGKMQSGKTTVAEYLEDELTCDFQYCSYFEQVNFADAIRRVVWDLFVRPVDGVSGNPRDFKNQSKKETIHPCGASYRSILQRVGYQMRGIWPDIWIEWWKLHIQDFDQDDQFFIVSDVRFPNEVKAIQDMGGIVIRLTRNPVDSDNETETALDECEQDTLCRSGKLDVFARKVRVADDEREGILLCDFLVHNSDLSIDETNRACFKIAKEYINEP